MPLEATELPEMPAPVMVADEPLSVDEQPAAPQPFGGRWANKLRVFITLADQGIVSIASFLTTFLLLRYFDGDKDAAVRNFAYFTMAGNLMIWASEFQAALVFTPHTILTPRLSGDALRRFHGSTLLLNTAVTLITIFATLIGAAVRTHWDNELAIVLAVLAGSLLLINLRNYIRPYAFAAREPISALVLDTVVAVLQIGGLLLLKHVGRLEAWTATAVMGAACLPSIAWLAIYRKRFKPTIAETIKDVKQEWPHSRFVFLSGMVWNAGMQLYVWLIAILAGSAEVAAWGACYQLACVANPLMMGMQNFIGPRIAEACIEMSPAKFTKHVYRIAAFTAVLMAGPAILLSIFAGPALVWLSKGKYSGHTVTITLLCMGVIVQAITFTLSRGLFALKRADLDLYCNFLPIATLLTFGVWATHAYGVAGAACSLLIAQLFSAGSRGVLFAYAVRNAKPQHDDDIDPPAFNEPWPENQPLPELKRRPSISLKPALEPAPFSSDSTAMTHASRFVSHDIYRPANISLAAPDLRPKVLTATPWVTALLIFVIFAMADWSLDASQWYASDASEVGAMVDRISEGQSQRQIALGVMFMYGICLLLLPSARRVRMKLAVFYPIVVFCVWAFISVLWSTDKALTLKRLVVFAAAITTVAGVLKHFDWKQIAQIALIGSGLSIACASLNDMRVVAVNHVPLGLWRLGGVLHPNHTALHAGVGMLASLYLYKLTSRRWLLLFFVGMTAALMATKSRTALMAIMTGVAVFWILSSSRSKTGWALIGAAWLGAAMLWLSSMGDAVNLNSMAQMGRSDVKNQDVTQLTGRTDIWKFALMQARKDPNRDWTGYGFESFWTPDNARGVSEFVNFRISEGHCIYLDWFLELGFVGAGLWVLIILTGIIRWGSAAWRLRSATAAVGAAILAGTVVHGFAESSLGDVSFPTFFVYTAIAGSAVRRPDEELE